MVFKKKISFEWEDVFYNDTAGGIHCATWRAKVYGGWLVHNTVAIKSIPAVGMVFVPDPNWEWSIHDERNDIVRKELKDIESTLHNLKNRQ